jgi:OPA family glycerol-3-phosphate transporter-like MFS transporter 1/2
MNVFHPLFSVITEKSKANAANAAAGKKQEAEPEPIGFMEAFQLPNVASYALAFGFFKLVSVKRLKVFAYLDLLIFFFLCLQVNYAMFFQLPLILTAHFDPSTSNVISSLYSVGMMPGGVVCGWVSDLYNGRRACVIATFMGVLCPLLLLFAWYMDELPVIVLLILLAFMGCLVGGPNNIITSAVAADLADDPSIKGNNKALGTVTGIINGSGSVTAAFGQMAIPVLFNWGKEVGVGYRYVWYFLIACTMAGTALMSGRIYKELYPHEDGHITSTRVPLASRAAGGHTHNYQAVSQEEKA